MFVFSYRTILKRVIFYIIIPAIFILFSCKKEKEDPQPPLISLSLGQNFVKEGDTLEIGERILFGVSAIATDDANITNFTIKLESGGVTKTILDSGLNSQGFNVNKIYYQGIEDEATWIFSVMDRNRLSTSISLKLYKDPNSTFGGIYEYNSITLGMHENNTYPHFFSATNGLSYSNDSANLEQSLIDALVYFKYSIDNGINLPSPTFSSPGEDANGVGDLYDIYYPQLVNWTTRNSTKYDIREDNGVTLADFNAAHNDSLLIVSYDDVWGKKKYKWAVTGTIIPFQTVAGKKGLIYVEEADTVATGKITFSMKVQI